MRCGQYITEPHTDVIIKFYLHTHIPEVHMVMHVGLDVGTKNFPSVKFIVFLLLNLGIVLSTLAIGSCAVEVLPGASTERNTWIKQPERNDYQQLQTVSLGSVTLDKIVFFTIHMTVDEVCVV